MAEITQLTFTQGFLLGQISFLAIILLFMRYVVFSPADKGDSEGYKKRREDREKKALLASKSLPTPPPGPAHILAKTVYEMATHGAESTDWINVLFAQVMQGYRNDLLANGGEEGAKLRVERILNPDGGRTSWLDPIEVSSISLGSAYPLFSNARIRPADAQGRIRAEIDVDYNDSIALALSTSVLINFPRPRFAVLPVSLGVELVSIGGTIHDPVDNRQHLHACLLPDFHLNLKTTTLLGSRAKLQDVPKLEQLILSRIRSAITDRFVHPAHFTLSLPMLLNPAKPPTGRTAQKMLDELGEEALETMGRAVKDGFGRLVNDLGLDQIAGSDDGIADGQTTGNTTRQGSEVGNTTGDMHMPLPERVGSNANVPAQSQDHRLRGRRIHMPAGFPYSQPSSTADPTPLPTPGPSTLSTSLQPAPSRMTSALPTPSLSRSASQRVRTDGSLSGGISTATSYRNSGPGSVTASQPARERTTDKLGFSGQFAGPGAVDGETPGSTIRRLGALNSRA